jgi:hypothetical protein
MKPNPGLIFHPTCFIRNQAICQIKYRAITLDSGRHGPDPDSMPPGGLQQAFSPPETTILKVTKNV